MTKTTWCPVCRGEIHAIAGRCKHCKADLVDLRERASRAARAQALGAVVPPPPRPPAAAIQVTPPTAAAPPPPMPEPAATWVDTSPPAMSAGTPPMGTPEVGAPTAEPWPQPYQEPYAAGPPPHARSTWSRRWPLVVSAVALLAIGISIGMLAERWRQGHGGPADGRLKSASTRPHQVPDHMPLPLLPGPGAPRQIDPDSIGPGMPTAPGPVPSPSNPGSRFGGGSDPATGGDATAFRTFTASLTESLCKKLSECGVIDSATQSVCQAFAQEFDPEDAAAKVARGECSFNQRAADACLRAVADLRCDAAGSGDMMDLLKNTNQVGECAQAYVCQ
ncbi:MAG TPA: hypothetical protein VFU21_18930 [Kofleriaceae bacterium]|nr:hypothetical protein [Kofleriaceae bacterium]